MIGMITEQAANSDSQERVLLYDTWRVLRGEECEEIQSEDLRVLALSVLRLHDHKRIGVEPKEEEMETVSDDTIGYFNVDNRFVLRPNDIAKIMRHYDLFYLNRIQFLGKGNNNVGQKRQSKATVGADDYSFKPQLNTLTQHIAANYRNKISE